MKKWEYKIQLVGPPLQFDKLEKKLNELGNDGWEVVEIVNIRDIFSIYLKKEIIK